MAKKINPDVDELLDAPETSVDKDSINAEIEALKAAIKEKKAALKGEKVKVPRELKGEMVTFTNKAGDRITGLGVLYYVARMNGKLHYKEASQVTKMTPEEVATWEAENKA